MSITTKKEGLRFNHIGITPCYTYRFEEYMEVQDSMVFNPNAITYKKPLPTHDPLLCQQIIKARKEAKYSSIKTSIFNKKALVRQDQ